MGQCMSRKAAGAFAASAAAAHSRPSKKMQKHKSPGDDTDENHMPSGKSASSHTKGVATSFGFKRRPTIAPSIAANSMAARRLASTNTDAAAVIDRNGNGHHHHHSSADTEPLTSNAAPTGRSTPRLMPPKKEPNATRVNRFGFRQPQVNRLNKVADLNNHQPQHVDTAYNNNHHPPTRVNNCTTQQASFNNMMVVASNNNRNTRIGKVPAPQAERYMLQTTHLPRPEPVRVIETKTAKTLANTNRKIAAANYHHEDNNSSKDGSLTEDSGVGSHVGGSEGEGIPGLRRLNYSPTYGARRGYHKSRNLEIVRSANSTFDVLDLEDHGDGCVPLPQLPSAFSTVNDNLRSVYHNTGYVRDMAKEYQRHHHLDPPTRKISSTSSEGFSDDYCDEEKPYKDRFKTEKSFTKPAPLHKSFLKSRPEACNNPKTDSSPASSDEQEWIHGGEAMADEVSFSITSSSDESKDHLPLSGISSALHSLITASISSSSSLSKPEMRNCLLTIEDPKFAAVAAATVTNLLDEETSPVDSLISGSESQEDMIKKKMARSSSNSKDINEKLTPPSPGTPTNGSNSLSISDGKDDFLIDDEIADQPALVFEDGKTDNFSISEATIVDSTPKPKRRAFEGSPLLLRKNNKLFRSRTGSLDTLSPCESIASDDLMMDFDYSQSSGLDDVERNDSHQNGYHSLDDTIILRTETDAKGGDILRDWSALLGNYTADKCAKSNATRNSRLLWSRTGTPNSIPDSPKSLDSRATNRSRPSLTSSPLRFSKAGGQPTLPSTGYDSDDSIRLDRQNHTAMKQDIISIKTMLLKLRRVLNESETHIPFDGQLMLTNGLFNGLSSNPQSENDGEDTTAFELAELRRQVLFLQGQLEDKEKTVQTLQEEVIKITNDNYTSNSAPASTVSTTTDMCNAATQTERIRPISAGPSLLNGASLDSSAGSLVSASESPPQRRSRPPLQADSSRRNPSKAQLWRKPGEPPSPRPSSSIPRRANSRNRTPYAQS